MRKPMVAAYVVVGSSIVASLTLPAQTKRDASLVVPVVSDPWPVTTDDAVSAMRTFTSGGASLDAKLAAVIKADREQLRKKLGDAANPTTPTQPTPTTPTPAKPTWITFTDLNGFNGTATINLDKAVCYWRATDADGAPTIMFSGESGLLGTAAETPELVKFLAEHTAATSFVAKAAVK